MGILNTTPDSFFDGGKYNQLDSALKRAEAMLADGADVIDVGGESTRPGSQKVKAPEEMERVLPVIEKIKANFPVPVSIDTSKSEVALAAIEAGASIVNDISGLSADANMLRCAQKNVSFVLGHIQGTPQNMQINPQYENVLEEVENFLEEKAKLLMEHGVEPEKIALDPGIGFGKTVEHNYQLIRGISVLAEKKFPIVMGLSRKSFMGKTKGLENSNRLIPTVTLGILCLLKGASVLRVHDVKETRESIDALQKALGE